MHSVIRKLGFVYVMMIAVSLPSYATSKSFNNFDDKGYIEIQDNEKACVCQDSNIFDKTQEKILKNHKLGYDKYKWLFSPYSCAKLTIKGFENAYIYEYYDKNSPIHVFILYDRETKKYLLAKVERADYLQLISKGKISYMGSGKNIIKMRTILQTYINDQNHS